MAKIGSAKRYSQAVFEMALEKNELEKWQADLKEIAAMLREIELFSLLENPRIPFDKKKELLDKRLQGVTPLAMNLAYLLISKRKLSLADQIAAGYEQLVNAHRGIEQATVTTAVLLDEKDKQAVANLLGAIAGKKLILETQVNPAILGGVVAKIGDKVIDGSTRNKLDTLHKSLGGAQG